MELMYDMLALGVSDGPRESPPCCWQGTEPIASSPIDVPEGHHYLSHHGRDEEKLEKIAKIDLYYMQHFARFLRNWRRFRMSMEPPFSTIP